MPAFADPITACTKCVLGIAVPARCAFAPRQAEPGTVLCAQGERSEFIFFVRKGIVTLSTADAEGGERGYALRGPGALICGESLYELPSPVEVRALSPVSICAATPKVVDAWLALGPATARALLQLLLDEISRQRDDSCWARGDCVARVARIVLAQPDLNAAGAPRRLAKQAMARLLHMRPETFSRSLRKLADMGLVDGSGRMGIIDRAKLTSMASQGLD